MAAAGCTSRLEVLHIRARALSLVSMEWQNKRKPTDRTLDEKVYRILPRADIFLRMQDVESSLDALVQRKRLDLQDMIGRSMRVHQTLRLYVSSQVEGQAWQGGGEASWTLRVEGRLLDEDSDKARAFSSMVTSVVIELQSGDAPAEIVEWHEASIPPEQRVEFDGLDVSRSGSEDVRAKIQIQLKEYPDLFKLSPELAAIVGASEESKPGVVVAVWQYIRYHQLQDVDEKRLVRCNQPLQTLFKRDKVVLPQLLELLAPHMTPREPVTIEYTVKPGQQLNNRDVAFDVPIQVDHALRSELLAMLNTWPQCSAMIAHNDSGIVQDVQTLNMLAYQHDFYQELCEDPINFIEKWVASQAADLKAIYSDRQFSEEAVRHSSFYTDDLINPALHLFLGKNYAA